MSRRRSHCPKRGRGRGGGPWPAGEGLGLRGPGAGAREEHVGSCPPFSPLPGQERGPGTNWSRQPGEGAGPQGWGRGAGAAAAPTPVPTPGLAALRPGKFPPSSELRELRAPSPPPAPPDQPRVGGGRWGFCTKGHRPGGIWAPIMTFPGLQMGVGWERAPDYWYPPILSP